ncbi:TPA: Dot/Icm T4SS effector Lem8, partial [Legionella pneumophila]|nr:Dot/Icm T4SS effector Lem8 [Legionella pneumophila]
MPQILNALAAVIEADLVKLNPEQKEIVDKYSDKLLNVQYKAHQPRTFELAVKTMKEQLEQLSTSLKKINSEMAPDKDKRRHEMIQKIESDLKLIESCINGDFEKNYQNLKKEFLQFLHEADSKDPFLKKIHGL